MRRFFLYISYKGTAYHGWQVQPGTLTIQGVLESALSTLLQEELSVTGAGRTDAGVHAELMVAHFDSARAGDILDKLVYKLNGILPDDISVTNIREVNADAHARFDAISRTYQYRISTRKDPFSNRLRARIYDKLDLEEMNKACSYLPGYSDFTSFSKLHTDVKTNNCKVEYAKWLKDNDGIIFEIKADRFLRNMVRAIVGTSLDIGRGKYEASYIKEVIEKKDRSAAGKSVSADGLFLTAIEYPENIFI